MKHEEMPFLKITTASRSKLKHWKPQVVGFPKIIRIQQDRWLSIRGEPSELTGVTSSLQLDPKWAHWSQAAVAAQPRSAFSRAHWSHATTAAQPGSGLWGYFNAFGAHFSGTAAMAWPRSGLQKPLELSGPWILPWTSWRTIKNMEVHRWIVGGKFSWTRDSWTTNQTNSWWILISEEVDTHPYSTLSSATQRPLLRL